MTLYFQGGMKCYFVFADNRVCLQLFYLFYFNLVSSLLFQGTARTQCLRIMIMYYFTRSFTNTDDAISLWKWQQSAPDVVPQSFSFIWTILTDGFYTGLEWNTAGLVAQRMKWRKNTNVYGLDRQRFLWGIRWSVSFWIFHVIHGFFFSHWQWGIINSLQLPIAFKCQWIWQI